MFITIVWFLTGSQSTYVEVLFDQQSQYNEDMKANTVAVVAYLGAANAFVRPMASRLSTITPFINKVRHTYVSYVCSTWYELLEGWK